MKKKICIVIPCYNVGNKIKDVLNSIDYEIIEKVIVVDDSCPEKSGEIAKSLNLKKIDVIFSKKNLGVGGATMLGFKKAINERFDILFKLDGDGQHDPIYIHDFKKIFENENINFCKGSRFLIPEEKKKIPKIRLLGNIILTYITKKICKIDNITDAVNGFLAIDTKILQKINLDSVSFDYFFEEDLLFNLSFHDLKIKEIPIKTIYFKNRSNLNPLLVILPFLFRHFKNLLFRIKYEFYKKK